MTTCQMVSLLLLACLFSVAPICAAQAPDTAKEAGASRKSAIPAGKDKEDLRARITFRFDILDLLTDHQFKGQKNSFHVEYELRGSWRELGLIQRGMLCPPRPIPIFSRCATRSWIASRTTRTKTISMSCSA